MKLLSVWTTEPGYGIECIFAADKEWADKHPDEFQEALDEVNEGWCIGEQHLRRLVLEVDEAAVRAALAVEPPTIQTNVEGYP